MSDDELLGQASQVVDHWISTPAGRLPYEIGGGRSGAPKADDVRGPFARRSFAIPDALIEPWLENDIEVLPASTHGPWRRTWRSFATSATST